jgi:hypothetical protein
MKKFAFAVSVFALGFVASAPARADYVVVKFDPGYCRIWWDSSMKPYGTGWSFMGRPYADWPSAYAALTADWASKACL